MSVFEINNIKMYAHHFASRALQVLRANMISSKERTYEALRGHMAACRAHVMVNGEAYAYGCVHASDAATRAHLKRLYLDRLNDLNQELDTAFDTWDAVTSDSIVSAVRSSMCASSSLLARTGAEAGNEQNAVHNMLSHLLRELEREKEIQTCCRECTRCEGDTIETHFGCLAMHNPRVSQEDWYLILLGFLAHSVQQGDFLPYYSRNVRVPPVDTVHALLEWLGESEWSSSVDPESSLARLAAVWDLPSVPRDAADVVRLLPPTSCHTLAEFKNMVRHMQQPTFRESVE